MSLVEIWTGFPHELQSQGRLRRLSAKKKPTQAELDQIVEDSKIVRGLSNRRRAIGFGSTALALAAIGGVSYCGINSRVRVDQAQPASNQGTEGLITPQDGEIFANLNSGFAALAALDPQAQKLYQLYLLRQKKAININGGLFSQETAGRDDLLVALVSPERNPIKFQRMTGIGEFDDHAPPRSIQLKAVPLSIPWAGAVISHETFHASRSYERGKPLTSPSEGIAEEFDAYDLEIRLVDKYYQGRFKALAVQIAKQIPPNPDRFALSDNNRQQFSDIFGPSLSVEETDMRNGLSLLAVAYSWVDSTAANFVRARESKIEVTRRIYAAFHPIYRY